MQIKNTPACDGKFNRQFAIQNKYKRNKINTLQDRRTADLTKEI